MSTVSKIKLALLAIAISLGLSVTARAQEVRTEAGVQVFEFVATHQAAGKGDACYITEKTGVVVLTVGAECPPAAELDNEITALLNRLGAPVNLLKGTKFTFTKPWLIANINGRWILLDGATYAKEPNQVLVTTSAANVPNTTRHELGHAAWNRIGMPSAFLDKDADSPEKKAVLNLDSKLPEGPARTLFEAWKHAETLTNQKSQ